MSEPDVAAWTRQQVEAGLALARAAGGGEWQTGCTCEGDCPDYPSCDEVTGDGIHIYSEGGHDADQAALIAANDPQDTIARCEAELGILDEHYILTRGDRNEAYEEFSVVKIGGADKDSGCVTCHYYGQGGVKGYGTCRTVRLLASGYRHRPGYQEALKPDKQG